MKRVLRRDGDIIGQIRILFWWIDVKSFTYWPDALKWLGYDDED